MKMLSYLLANREVQGIRTVDRFQKKFQEDPETYRLIQSVTQGQTERVPPSIRREKRGILARFQG